MVNFLIFIGGLVVVSVGVWTLADKAFIQRLLRNELFISSAYILIVAGLVIVFISFLGCFGAWKEVKCMLLTYFIFLFLMFVVLVIGGVLGYVFRTQVMKDVCVAKCVRSALFVACLLGLFRSRTTSGRK